MPARPDPVHDHDRHPGRLLHRYSGQRDLRIGAPVANRIRPESEGLIGAFLNTQVLRCQLDGQMSARAARAGAPHRDRRPVAPGPAVRPLVERCSRRAARLQPAVPGDVQRAALGLPAKPTLAGMQVEYLANDASATKFDLYLEVTDLDGRLAAA
jgi:non-ribosomal peptide synthetase component F